jgi:putative SOS response-associated peptidase YedK
MCGRFALKASSSDLIQRFGLDECVDLTPRCNIPPGTEIAVIRQSPTGLSVLHRLKWGQVRAWCQPETPECELAAKSC